MNYRENRGLGFVIISVIYLLAAAAGVVSYILLPFNRTINLLIADVTATVVTFVFSVIFGNASVYDPYWSVQPIVILVAFFTVSEVSLSGILIGVAVTYWGVRLTANWAYTFRGLNCQDWRYTMLKERTGKFYPVVNFLGIHLFPTLVVYLCVLPVVEVLTGAPQANVWSFAGFAISVCAVTLQLTADIQMHKYRKNRTGNFIRTGLWKYSRHPNYLGEILMWWGVAVSAVFTVGGWYLIAGALVNTLMFLFVSIPMADKRQAKKDGFEEYKRQTRMLLPICKKQ
ncbi:MAG: DUF1295 domain-containing protein [Clostridia bacterium]|nr:DUF1295 domain-containing protein [Clostridia bacterium]